MATSSKTRLLLPWSTNYINLPWRNKGKIVTQCWVYTLAKQVKQNVGLYTLLSVPIKLWDDFNINFFLGLSCTLRHHNFVRIIVVSFFKMTHFIACSKMFDASHVTQFHFNEVINLHSLPNSSVWFRCSFYKLFLKNLVTSIEN